MQSVGQKNIRRIESKTCWCFSRPQRWHYLCGFQSRYTANWSQNDLYFTYLLISITRFEWSRYVYYLLSGFSSTTSLPSFILTYIYLNVNYLYRFKGRWTTFNHQLQRSNHKALGYESIFSIWRPRKYKTRSQLSCLGLPLAKCAKKQYVLFG